VPEKKRAIFNGNFEFEIMNLTVDSPAIPPPNIEIAIVVLSENI
jgi:hypothetical protein